MLLEDLKINLQLFSEEDGITDEDTTDTGDDVGEQYSLDEDGNLVISDGRAEPEEEDEETGDEDTNEDDEDPTEDTPAVFKVKVDGQELDVSLDELLNGYMRQADYTKKTQSVAQERARLQSALNPVPQQEQAPVNTTKAFYESLTNVAKEIVAKEVEEDFDEFNPLHMSALAVKVNQISSEMQQHQAKQQSVETFESESRAKEPEHYDAIYEYAKEKVDFLPYRERVALEQAFSAGDTTVMKSFFDSMRKDYYNSKGIAVPGEQLAPKPTKIKKSITPPIVETGGQGDDKSKPKTRNASELGKLSTDKQAQWLIDMGII